MDGSQPEGGSRLNADLPWGDREVSTSCFVAALDFGCNYELKCLRELISGETLKAAAIRRSPERW